MHGARQATGDDGGVVAILSWWDAEARDLPWRATRDVYAIWVAEVMSAQTTVGRAASAWEAWMARWPTVHALAGAPLGDVLSQWQGLGYPRRARDLHRAANRVAADGWPDDLMTLPGVGPYVSSAVRCFALEEAVLPRDVNVNRVLARRFPRGVDISADPWRMGQALMEFGQRICSVVPKCVSCPAAAGCGGPQADESAQRARRRQKPYAGSLRQRRGQLLARALAEGRIPREGADPVAVAGLLSDGLLAGDDDWLYPPS